MRKKTRALAALILVLCLLLTGCKLDFAGYFQRMGMLLKASSGMTDFNDMVYTRPDIAQMQSTVDACCEKVASASSLDEVVSIIYEAYAPMDAFSTAYALANIYYCKDLTNAYWAEEYAYCTENTAVAQAALDQLYRALAKCPFRDQLEGDAYFGAGFFNDYEGESIYDETFMALLMEESALENRYYTIWNEAGDQDPYSEAFLDTCGSQMAQLFVELIALRQQIAEYLGYESYPEFAYAYYYGRDYSCDQTTSYLADIRAELVPLYRQMCADGVDIQLDYCAESDTLHYVQSMAAAMGGTILQACNAMVEYSLYDIAYGENKYEASFEIYIRGYYSPYLFMNPTLTEYDKLTMAHEFGHFCCDYVTGGSQAGTDVAEVFSQGMEYLSLCYGQPDTDLEKLKMVNCLNIMVEQAAYASFEQQVYGLRGEELTVENVQALYAQIGSAYGFDSWDFDSRSYVYVNHFFTNPMYVISYVVSNDVALQLYQMEKNQSGAGLTALQNAFQSVDTGIVTFAANYGLESPFATGRIAAIRETLRAVLA